jgi:hypothetical protein
VHSPTKDNVVQPTLTVGSVPSLMELINEPDRLFLIWAKPYLVQHLYKLTSKHCCVNVYDALVCRLQFIVATEKRRHFGQ